MVFDCIFLLLEDGKPHSFESIMADLKERGVHHSEKKIKFALDFLETYAFVNRRRNGDYKLSLPLFCFLGHLKELEG